MMTNNIREMLAGYVDNELTDDQKRAFEKELAANKELQAELKEFQELQNVTGLVKYADLPDEVWHSYWQSIYKKLERGIGWILFSVGAIILLCTAVFTALQNLFVDPSVPMIIKIGVAALSVGIIFLLVSMGRERIFAYRRERYTEVDK